MNKLPKISSVNYRLGLDKLNLEKVSTDLESIYNKVMADLNSKTNLEPKDLSFMNFVLNVKRDKEETIKFLMNYELRQKELDVRNCTKEPSEGVIIND